MMDRRTLPITGPMTPSVTPVNPVLVRRTLPVNPMYARNMTSMAPGSTIMPTGRAYAKGGMVGCDWKPKSAATMRGNARKGK